MDRFAEKIRKYEVDALLKRIDELESKVEEISKLSEDTAKELLNN